MAGLILIAAFPLLMLAAVSLLRSGLSMFQSGLLAERKYREAVATSWKHQQAAYEHAYGKRNI